MRVKIHDKDADTNTILKCVISPELKGKEQEMFESESIELGIISIGSVISDIPMMQTSENISTSIVASTKKALRPVISKNKVGDRLKALLQNNKSSSFPNKTHGCILNKKKDYDSDYSQMKAPGLEKPESKP